MGSSLVTNDYELVIRVTKELDRVLSKDFGASAELALMQKINIVEETTSLSRGTFQNMRKLVAIRNRLVHDHACDSLLDCGISPGKFLEKYDRVCDELTMMQRPGHAIARSHQPDSSTGEDNQMGNGTALLVAGGVALMMALASTTSDDDRR